MELGSRPETLTFRTGNMRLQKDKVRVRESESRCYPELKLTNYLMIDWFKLIFYVLVAFFILHHILKVPHM